MKVERGGLGARRYWVFDLDGTLTLPVHDFAHIRRELGIAPQDDILDALAAMPEPLRSERHLRLDALERHYAGHARPAEGVHALLQGLSRRGCRCGILTRNTRELALLSLKAIGAAEYFDPDFVLGRDEARPKPDPGGLQRLLSLWRARPDEALMVGDFRYDLEAGRNAGTGTVHVDARPDRDWPELTDLRVQSLAELHRLLETG
ncbi:HAD family hydrolase [Marinobacterium nitratireducens]|uniref:HAD family hydrolase n=1 Tax=Marinobacterium nitratireducens TaxID=518897 RepID=UPI001E402830|nr:HAD family hydrolase [Marinobacterium nitratireducens]